MHQIILSQIGIKIHKNGNLHLHVVGESSFEFQGLNLIMKGDGKRQKERGESEEYWDCNFNYYLFKSAARFS